MLSLRDVGYVGHLQWDRISNSLTDWVNLYGAGTLGMGNKIYSWDGNKFTETTCSTLVPWFGKLMRRSKLSTSSCHIVDGHSRFRLMANRQLDRVSPSQLKLG